MKQSFLITFMLGTLGLCPMASGQKFEVGGGVGGGFYTSDDVRNGATTGTASLANAVDGSFWLGNNSSHLLGGELRYDYEKTSLKLSSSGQSVTFGADTHAVHYDLLFHFTPRESRIRPYVSGGGGIKLYRGTAKESAFQPLSGLALLSKTDDLTGMLSVGAGIKIAVAKALQLRVEIRDVLTPFPKTVISPAQGSKVSGWLQDFVALVGLSITF